MFAGYSAPWARGQSVSQSGLLARAPREATTFWGLPFVGARR
jgi:hypothetical protein